MDGNFSLKVYSTDILVVKYIGCKTQTIPLNGKTNLKIKMKKK